MSIGSIDPRVLGALLRLQLTSPLTTEDPDSGSLFGTLLDELLYGYGSTDPAAGGYGTGAYGNAPSALHVGSYPALYGGSTSTLYGGSLSALYSGLIGSGALYSGNLLPLLIQMRNASAAASGGDSDRYDELIRRSAERYGVDPALVKAVVRIESAFNPHAVSSAGAKGLMQLMDATARALGVDNPFDPEQNVTGGTRYLAWLIGKYGGNLKAALAAYNAGPGRVERLGILTDEAFDEKRSLLPEETQSYVDRVLEAFEHYRAANGAT